MKKVISLLCALIVLGSSGTGAVEVAAPSALLMEKETGTVLFAKDEHAKLEPASVTKVMTILLTMEAIDSGTLSYDTMITASAHACSMGGSQIWLKENEQMTVSDMLKAVCVVSANDCAVALGEAISGSEAAFVERMNQRAKELGMNDTTFRNATGLSNTNKLIRFYEGATGLKTGSTDNALYCLSGTAEREGMELIAVILKDITSAQRFEDAKTLLSYGFSTYTLKTVTPDAPLAPIPVRLGIQSTVQPVLGDGSTLLLEKNKAGDLTQSLALSETLDAPVAKGTPVGSLTVFSGEQVLAEIPVLAGEDVPRITYGQMLLRVLQTAFLAA